MKWTGSHANLIKVASVIHPPVAPIFGAEKREIMIIEGETQVIRQFLSHKLDQVLFGLGL